MVRLWLLRYPYFVRSIHMGKGCHHGVVSQCHFFLPVSSFSSEFGPRGPPDANKVVGAQRLDGRRTTWPTKVTGIAVVEFHIRTKYDSDARHWIRIEHGC